MNTAKKANMVALSLCAMVTILLLRSTWALTIKEAVLFSLDRYPGLRAERSFIKTVEKDLHIATFRYFPKFTVESRYIKTDSPADVFGLKLSREELSAEDFAGLPGTFNNPPSFETFVTSLNLRIPLFQPELLMARKAAKRSYVSENYRYGREAEVHAKRVIEAYVDVITARALLGAAESGVAEAEAHRNVAREREKAGVGIYADVLRAEVFLARAKEKRVMAGNAEKVARLALRVAMGAAEDYPIDGLVLPASPVEISSMETYLEIAHAERKDLRMMEEKVNVAAYGQRRIQVGYLPALSLFGTYELNGDDAPFDVRAENYTLGVLLKWDIFDGLVREGKVRKAKYHRERVRQLQKNLENQVRFSVEKAYLDVLEAASREEIARRAEEMAEEGLRLMEGRFENSLSRLVELLDAQSALDSARAQRIRAENDYYLALKELHFSSGQLLESIGIGGYSEVLQ